MFLVFDKRPSTAKTNIDLIFYCVETVRRIDTRIAKPKTSFINVGNEFNVNTQVVGMIYSAVCTVVRQFPLRNENAHKINVYYTYYFHPIIFDFESLRAETWFDRSA